MGFLTLIKILCLRGNKYSIYIYQVFSIIIENVIENILLPLVMKVEYNKYGEFLPSKL